MDREKYITKKALEDTRNLSIFNLHNRAEAGSPLAKFVLGEKLLESNNEIEQKKGSSLIIGALYSLEDDYFAGEVDKDLLLLVTIEGTDKLLKQLKGETETGDEVFRFCQNIYELDQTKANGLATCYEKGIGCEVDKNKAVRLKEKAAAYGGFIEKARIFIEYAKSDEIINAVIWAQMALSSDDRSNYPKLTSRVKIWLAQKEETDNEGRTVDVIKEKQDYKNSNVNNAEEAELLFYMAETDAERYEFADAGKEDFAHLREYSERVSREIKEKEEQKQLVNREREKARKKKIISVTIIVIIALVFALIAGIGNAQEKHRKEIEEQERLERVAVATNNNIDVTGDWYIVKPFQNKVQHAFSLTIDEEGNCIANADDKKGSFEYQPDKNELVIKNVGASKIQLVIENDCCYFDKDTSDECIYCHGPGKAGSVKDERIQQIMQQIVPGEYEQPVKKRQLIFYDDNTYKYIDHRSGIEEAGTWRCSYEKVIITNGESGEETLVEIESMAGLMDGDDTWIYVGDSIYGYIKR